MQNIKTNIDERKKLLILLFLPCLLIRRVLDNDTWFLLNSGRYVMNNGIPHIEPFSIHENMEFVMQQWLTDVVFWNIYDLAGEFGLFLFVTICYAVVIFLLYKLTMNISEGNFFVSFSVTMLATILIFTYMVVRPTIITLVLVMIELNVLEYYAKSNEYKYLIILPVLSLLMINFHAALWPMLFVLILPYVIDSYKFKVRFICGEGYNKVYLFLSILAMVLVAFVNPYGVDAMLYLIKSTGYPYMKYIMELQPPNVSSFAGALIYVYITLIAFVYIFYRKGKTKVRYFLLTIGTILMVLISVRNITYFALCSLFPLAYYLKDMNISHTVGNNKNTMLRIILVTLIFMVVSFSVYAGNRNNNTAKRYKDLNETIDYIIENENIINIILYTGFNEGSLVQFRGLPTYIDPRAEVYFKKQNKKDDIFNEYIELKYGKVYYKEVMRKYNFTHLIVEKGELLDTYLQKDENYIVIFENEKYKLYKMSS
jgi:hypothetical protein